MSSNRASLRPAVRVEEQARLKRERLPRHRGFSALVYGALLICLVYPYTDYDWGWHYRYGEYLLTHGRILRHDIFSWTMPGYEWANHSWLYDPLLYVLSAHISFLGLSLAGAATGLLIFHVSVRRTHLLFWQTAILAVFFAALSKEALMQGLRSQVVGLLLLSILVNLLFREREGHTRSYWTFPCLMCIWANLHGSFLLGLIIFGIHVICDFIILKIRGHALPRYWFVFAGSFLVSILATLINPFTYGVYLEAVRHVASPVLPLVVEWRRPEFSQLVRVLFLSYALLLAVGFIYRRRLADLPCLASAAVTMYLAVTSRRQVPVFVVATLPFAAALVGNARVRVEGMARTSLAVSLLMATFALAVFERGAELLDLWRNPTRAYCSYGPRCSEGLMQYLVREAPVGRGFNFYEWGGYLIGMGLKAKVFIDGRMALWERGDYRPVVEYWAMYAGHDLEAFERQHFDWVIVPSDSEFVRELAKYRSPRTGCPAMDVWEVVYRDSRALYLVRKRGR